MDTSFTLVNANILTLDPHKPIADSVTIKDGKIFSLSVKEPGVKTINLNGATVLPGLTDSHYHIKNTGKRLEMINLKGISDTKKIRDLVEERASSLPQGSWVQGFGWDQTLFSQGQFPSSDVLDSLDISNPVFLTRIDGHSAWVNEKALKISNFPTDVPSGGDVINSCILIDNAMSPVRQSIPKEMSSDLVRWSRASAERTVSLGVTGVHDAWTDRISLDALIDMEESNQLPHRVYSMLASSDTNLLEEYFNKGGYESGLISVRSAKAFIDGALGSRGAALFEPYSDDHNNCGLVLISPEEFKSLATSCYKNNFQLNVHAIGDRGNSLVIDTYSDVLGGPNDRRWRIEHAQMVRTQDIQRFKDFSLVPSMQPSHCTSDMRWMDDRIGTHRSHRISRWQSFIDMGLKIPGGSDCPIEDGNPLLEYYAAVTRKDRAGLPEGGWQPQEKVSRMNALRMFTTWAAYGAFSESRRGIIAPGFDADLTVLSNDITSCDEMEIIGTEVMMTVVGGKEVYNAL